jgi:hypothetical protein
MKNFLQRLLYNFNQLVSHGSRGASSKRHVGVYATLPHVIVPPSRSQQWTSSNSVCLLSLCPTLLDPAFSALKFIWSDAEQAQVNKQQLEVLAQSIAQLLQTLDREYHAGQLLQVKTVVPLANSCRFAGFIMIYISMRTSVIQAVRRYLGIRSEGDIKHIFEAPIYQGSKDYPDRELPPIYCHFN